MSNQNKNEPEVKEKERVTQKEILHYMNERSFEGLDISGLTFQDQKRNENDEPEVKKNLQGFNFTNCNLNGTKFINCDLRWSDMTDSNYQSAIFEDCNLREVAPLVGGLHSSVQNFANKPQEFKPKRANQDLVNKLKRANG